MSLASCEMTSTNEIRDNVARIVRFVATRLFVMCFVVLCSSAFLLLSRSQRPSPLALSSQMKKNHLFLLRRLANRGQHRRNLRISRRTETLRLGRRKPIVLMKQKRSCDRSHQEQRKYRKESQERFAYEENRDFRPAGAAWMNVSI